jgi:secondary thiamine-phosphate synthase enzyme
VETFNLRTSSRMEFVDITPQVDALVRQSGVTEGLCCVFVPHTTAGLTLNENVDPAVRQDILMELNRVVPFDDGYSHSEGNSAAHLKSSLMGQSLVVPISGGRLAVGPWQGIYFCEFDGPRQRRVYVAIK